MWQWPFNLGEYMPKSYYTDVHAKHCGGPNFTVVMEMLMHSKDKNVWLVTTDGSCEHKGYDAKKALACG